LGLASPDRTKKSGDRTWLRKGHQGVDDIVGRAVPNLAKWQYFVTKAEIDQDLCIKYGRCHIACKDTSHQAIATEKNGARHFEVRAEDCAGCSLCVNVCRVKNCIAMVPIPAGGIDPRTGETVGAPVTPAGRRTRTIPPPRPAFGIRPSSGDNAKKKDLRHPRCPDRARRAPVADRIFPATVAQRPVSILDNRSRLPGAAWP
jgi:Pyruvate/2-oxoacid:ferredoxin oxidoreductase delta subunit